MQKIILFIEPNKYAYQKSSKIGNLFMNRFVIDEDESNEILKIVELERKLWQMKYAKPNEGLDRIEYCCQN